MNIKSFEKYNDSPIGKKYFILPAFLHILFGYLPMGDSERMTVIYQKLDSKFETLINFENDVAIMYYCLISGFIYGVLTILLRNKISAEKLLTMTWLLLVINLKIGVFATYSPVFLIEP